MIVRPATAIDVQRYAETIAPRDFIGIVAEKNGDFLGAGLIIWAPDGRPWVCFEGKPELLPHKATIARWSVRLIRAAQQVCEELYAMEDKSLLGGSRWLEWLGFKETGEVVDGKRIVKWQRL